MAVRFKTSSLTPEQAVGMTQPNDLTWPSLAGRLGGDVLMPGSADYEAARRPAIARFAASRPAAIIRCHNAADVAAALDVARSHGLPVAVRSGGHCFAGHSSTTGLLIDLRPIDHIRLHGTAVVVGAGVTLGRLADDLELHGLTVPIGTCPTVGVAGFTLGGGFGMLGRRHGLASDHLVGATAVLADGSIVECGPDDHHDLLWALRGAGAAGFGVVTDLELRPVAAPRTVTVVHTTWDATAAPGLIDSWQVHAPDAPDHVALSLKATRGPSPDAPVHLTVRGSVLGPPADAVAMMRRIRAGAGVFPTEVAIEEVGFNIARRRWAALGHQPDGHAFAGGWPATRSEFFAARIPTDAITALLAHLHAAPPGLACELDLTPWAGAYARQRPDATAFPHRAARFLLKHTAECDVAAGPSLHQAAQRFVDGSWSIVHRYGTGGVYANFPDPALADPASAYYLDNVARLRRIRARQDRHTVLPDHHGLEVDSR
jgi:FAD/FMN-containing dehydrogenase